MRTKLTPSRIARAVAAIEWPDVQHQTMIAPGVYWFSCAGHGGCVAVHGKADIPEAAWTLARQHGLTARVVPAYGRLYTSQRYIFGDTVAADEVEVWIGEEDCDWATIFVAHADPAALIERANSKGFGFKAGMAPATCKSWHPDFYRQLTGEAVAVEDSIVLRDRTFEAANANNYVVISAWGAWHENVPEGMVGVSATLGGSRRGGAREAYFLVPASEYDKRQGRYVITNEAEWKGPNV